MKTLPKARLREPADDPLMDVAQISAHSSASTRSVHDALKLSHANPRHLKGIKHLGKLKARVSDVEDWLRRTSTPANS